MKTSALPRAMHVFRRDFGLKLAPKHVFCFNILKICLLWLFFKINAAHAQNQCFHFFCFEYVNVPMIILNEHMHLNMIDVYKKNRNNSQVMSQSYGHHPETSIKSSPREIRFSSRFFLSNKVIRETLFPSRAVQDHYPQK